MIQAKPRLAAVTSEAPEPPYARTTRAKGIKFEVDTERLYQSKTWIIAPHELRPWLLMLWVESWRSIPVGTFDDDDEMIAARIGMPLPMFSMYRQTLMRGWIRHSDGRLYHSTITEKVLDLVQWRESERTRKDVYRARKKAEREAAERRNNELENMSRGTPCPSASATTPSPSPSPSPSPEEEDISCAPAAHTPDLMAGFDDWWEAYGKKVNRKKCSAKWKSAKLHTKADMLIADAKRRHAEDDKWMSGYQPDPLTYLNGERWEDEITKARGNNNEARGNNNSRLEDTHARRKRINQMLLDKARSHFPEVV